MSKEKESIGGYFIERSFLSYHLKITCEGFLGIHKGNKKHGINSCLEMKKPCNKNLLKVNEIKKTVNEKTMQYKFITYTYINYHPLLEVYFLRYLKYTSKALQEYLNILKYTSNILQVYSKLLN